MISAYHQAERNEVFSYSDGSPCSTIHLCSLQELIQNSIQLSKNKKSKFLVAHTPRIRFQDP